MHGVAAKTLARMKALAEARGVNGVARARHRVAVTGIGIVTPLGIGIDAFWNGVLSERVAVAPITRFDAGGYRSRIAAQIDDFEPRDFLADKRLRWTDRFSQFAVAAARLALDDARLPSRTARRATSACTSARRLAGSRSPTSSTTCFASAGSRRSGRCSRSRCSAARRRATSRSSSTCAGRRSPTATRAPRARSRSAMRFARSRAATCAPRSRAASRRRSRRWCSARSRSSARCRRATTIRRRRAGRSTASATAS